MYKVVLLPKAEKTFARVDAPLAQRDQKVSSRWKSIGGSMPWLNQREFPIVGA